MVGRMGGRTGLRLKGHHLLLCVFCSRVTPALAMNDVVFSSNVRGQRAWPSAEVQLSTRVTARHEGGATIRMCSAVWSSRPQEQVGDERHLNTKCFLYSCGSAMLEPRERP